MAQPPIELVVGAIILAFGGCSNRVDGRHGDLGAVDPPAAVADMSDVVGTRGDMAVAARDLAPGVAGADLASGADGGELTIYSCDNKAYGTVGAVYRGVPVYCEPSSGTGYYQCDELANRWVRDALQHPNIENVATDSADSICTKASMIGGGWYSVYGPGFLDSHGHVPVAGDLIVWKTDPPWTGHTAVITDVAATMVAYVQQNDGPPNATIDWDANASFFTSAKALCWIHAEPHAPASTPAGSDCGCFVAGDTCGLAIVDHEYWYGCAAKASGPIAYDTLYSCAGGMFTPKQVCMNGCIVDGLSPATGHCAP